MNSSLDEQVPSRKRRRRSKKKRLRKKKRASLETKVKTEEDENRRNEHIIHAQSDESDEEPSKEELYTPQGPEVKDQNQNQEHNVQVQTQVEEQYQKSSNEEEDEVVDNHKRREKILDLKNTSSGFETEKEDKQELSPALRVKEETTLQTIQQSQIEKQNQDSSDEDDDEVVDYERKRRENILRNQAYLKSVGISTAKFAARTAISYGAEKEAEKEVKQELQAKKRALRATETKLQQQTEVINQDQDSNEEDDDEMTDYERKRRENILRNQAYLKSVGMPTAKFAARTSIGPEVGAKKAEMRSLRAAPQWTEAEEEDEDQDSSEEEDDEVIKYEHKRRSLRIEHKRRSLRIQKKSTEKKSTERRSRARAHLRRDKVPDLKQQMDLGHPLDLLYAKTMRQPIGSRLYVMDAADDEGKKFCKELAGGVDTFESNETGDDVDYSLADTDMVKALPYCTTAMAFLPRADRIVVAAGDKEGHIALWSPSSDDEESMAALSRPHGFPVSHLIFPDSSTLVSSSIDGTVREFDFWTGRTSPIGDLSEETGISSLIGSGNPQFYYAACEDGTLRLVDRRARNMFNSQYALHKTRINSVDQHPSLAFCIATASRDATVCLWDKRKISPENNAPVARLLHKNNVISALFSPGDGSWLAAVGRDYFDMYDTSNLVKCNESGENSFSIPKWVRIPHKTSGHLHPAWDPRRKDRLVIACLEKPARLQIFRAGEKKPIQELTSTRLSRNPKLAIQHPVDLMTAYHPSVDIIASSNSTGVLSLWRAKPKE